MGVGEEETVVGVLQNDSAKKTPRTPRSGSSGGKTPSFKEKIAAEIIKTTSEIEELKRQLEEKQQHKAKLLKYQEELNKKEKSPKVKFDKKTVFQAEESKTVNKGRSTSIKSESSNPELHSAVAKEEKKLTTSPKQGF